MFDHYPTAGEIVSLCKTAGLDLAPEANPVLAAGVGKTEFERRANRKMLVGASATRKYDPPTDPNVLLLSGGERESVLRIHDVIGTPTIAYQPRGSTAETLVEGTDYDLDPANAAAEERPFTRIQFYRSWAGPLSDTLRLSIRVTGTFGYWSTIPADAFQAMLFLGVLDLLEAAKQNKTGGVTGWRALDYEEQYGQNTLRNLLDDWQKQADATVRRYWRPSA